MLLAGIAFALGFLLPLGMTRLLPAADPDYPYSAMTASFVLNLGCIALALAFLPAPEQIPARPIFVHVRAWLQSCVPMACAFAGLYMAPVHHETARVFVTLALLSMTQAGLLFAVHALLRVVCGTNNRAPETACALMLCVLASALFWSGEPIERLTKSENNGAARSAQLADSVMKLSPPMAVAATWYQESDAARTAQTRSARRFDIVHGPLTYAVWIGSYQAIANPDIMPSGGTGDFYNRREFTPGIVLIMALWSIIVIALCDVLMWRNRVSAIATQPTN